MEKLVAMEGYEDFADTGVLERLMATAAPRKQSCFMINHQVKCT